MASPRQIHIFPNCGLEIEIDKSKFHGLDWTNSFKPWKYRVSNCDQIFSDSLARADCTAYQDNFEGWLSPASLITLPLTIKKKSGIPVNATSYSFMYPPKGLAEILLKRNYQDNRDSFSDDPKSSQHIIKKQGIESAAILGGFVYFDKKFDCISINALSMQRSERTLKFSGPFKVNQCACDKLLKLGRSQPLQLDIFHEVGFVSFAWVRPEELFQFKSVFETEGPQNTYGTMIFFRENGTGVSYAVDRFRYVDPAGYVGILSEAVQRIGEAKFTQQAIQPIDEVNAWGARSKYWTKSMNIAKLSIAIEDKRRVIHMACHAALGHEFISDVLSNVEEKENLSYQDSLGWNPLHYACCFSPRDYTLIKLLVTECPEAVVQLDIYDRHPLHIACNSDTSEEVIALLLKADTCIPKVTINTATRGFGLLPLHLACFNGAQDSIINALLDADNDNKTAIQKSRCGYSPLHLAILKKLPANVVKAFLDVDSENVELKLKPDFDFLAGELDGDIYQSTNGFIPLQLACYNNSSIEIIQMLLEKDEYNITVIMTADHAPRFADVEAGTPIFFGDASSLRCIQLKRENRMKRQASEKNTSTKSTSSFGKQSDGVVALHLAMRHGSNAVIGLLLDKNIGYEEDDYRVSILHKRDALGRTPLHIACEYNVCSHLIQQLLDLDPFKKSTLICDLLGFMPIHYACKNKDTSAETINILLDAEEQYLEDEFTKGCEKQKSTHTGDTERNSTPLYLAIKSGVDTQIIERLLQPENFSLKGIDKPAMGDLAEVVKNNRAVQGKVIQRLSERGYFCQLILELYTCIASILALIYGTIKYVEGDGTIIEPTILLLSALLFIARELIQILSVGTDYIQDLWSLLENINIVLLLVTSVLMFREAGNPGPHKPDKMYVHILTLTGMFVVIQFIVYLRATLLPFAKFVGGMVTITKKLIPFLVVMLLLLTFFVYAFWLSSSDEEEIDWSGNFRLIFEFDQDVLWLEVAFAFVIIIVLFNILIAIVSEAWASATKKASGLFWKYRLEKINELRATGQWNFHLTPGSKTREVQRKKKISKTTLTERIDNVRNVSYGDNIPWNKSPYNVVTEKDHYDNPGRYFSPEQAQIINDAHSLLADIYWAKKDNDLTICGKFMLILKWLGSCVHYGLLIILGIPTLGILWPKNFRSGLLTWDTD